MTIWEPINERPQVLLWWRHLWPKCSVLAPVTLRPPSPLIGQHTHTWPSTANHNKAVVLNLFLCIKIAAWHILSRCMTWWRGVSWASFSVGFCRCRLWPFFYMHKKLYKWLKQKKKTKKHILIHSFNRISLSSKKVGLWQPYSYW